MWFVRRYVVLLALLLWPALASAQIALRSEEVPLSFEDRRAEEGMPFFIEQFSHHEYGRHYQNWAVTQDGRGVVYVANFEGLLEYDGVGWRSINTPDNVVARSMATDASGRVFVGLQGDMGYLAPDSLGQTRYVSLRGELAPADRTLGDVWATHATSEGVYFQTAERLYRWDGETMQVWNGAKPFHTSLVVRDELYVRQREVGLLRMRGGQLDLLPGGERFADLRIYMMAPYGDDQILVATREEGLFLYDASGFQAFPTEADALLKAHRLYHGTVLPGGLFALAMLDGGGVVVLDEAGQIVRRLDASLGIDDWINYVYADTQGGLWMALDNKGLARVGYPTRLSRFDQKQGLSGQIADIRRHQGRLYVATTKALYYLQTPVGQEAGVPSFAQVEMPDGSSLKARALLSADSLLFVGTDEGLYILREHQRPRRIIEEAVYSLHATPQFKDRIFLGMEEGVGLLQHRAGGWEVTYPLIKFENRIFSISEAGGDFWITTKTQLRRVRFEGEQAVPVIESIKREGTPLVGETRVYELNDAPLFATQEGVFRYQPAAREGETGRFVPEQNVLSTALADSLLSFHVDPSKAIWIVYPDRIEIAVPQADGSYTYTAPPALGFDKAPAVQVYVEKDGIAWIGNGEELIRYDPLMPGRYDAPFTVLIRQIESRNTGQVLYAGWSPEQDGGLRFDPIHQSFNVQVAAASYNAVDQNEYQYYLEGAEADWSAWTSLWSRNYNRLGPGTYRLHVRARNGQGVESNEAVLTFTLLPPWYRTWWAFALYIVLAFAFGYLSVRHYRVVQENKRAQEQARELERERYINERLQVANKRLQEANESLTQVNQLKDEFLANTSHELRTPLTAILGFTSLLQEELPKAYREFLDPIESNGQRLLSTVNSLLDIAKLRAGMMEVMPEEVNVSRQAHEVIRLLEPLAQRKGLPLELVEPAEPVYIYVDQRYFERILYNLVGNAIKFTERGQVTVEVIRKDDGIAVRVQDTGIGIDASFLPHLFDEFKQESTGLGRLHEGTGLGLTISARLVELMGGEIEVQSKKGEGSVFTVTFPMHVSAEVKEPSIAG